jgi:ribose transport system permease protein
MSSSTPSLAAARDGSATPDVASRWRRVRASARPETWGPVLVLVALCLVFAVASSRFATLANLHTVADQAAVPMVLAVGLTFVVLMGSIDLSLEGVMGVSSIAVALLVANDVNGNHLGWLGVALAVGAGLAAGVVSGAVHVVFRIPSLMVTVGGWFVALGIASLLFPGRQPRLLDGGVTGLGSERLLGFSKLDAIAVGVVVLALLLQRFTGFGRALYAIGGDEATARTSGLKVDRVKVAAFAFAGACAGLAGVMTAAKLGVGKVDAGLGQLFPTVAAVVIGGTLLTGGRGGVAHTIVGVLILTVLADGLILIGVDPYIQQGIEGLVLVLAVAAGGWQLRSRLRVVK